MFYPKFLGQGMEVNKTNVCSFKAHTTLLCCFVPFSRTSEQIKITESKSEKKMQHFYRYICLDQWTEVSQTDSIYKGTVLLSELISFRFQLFGN